MDAGRELTTLLFSSSLAFLAFLPAVISIMVNHYKTERNRSGGGSWVDLRWQRRLIGVVVLAFWLALVTALLLLSRLFAIASVPVELPVGIFVLDVLLLTGGLTFFIHRIFEEDRPRHA